MSDIDAEDLIARLCGGLDPHDRAAFRRTAENALATSPECSGEGSTYRVIARLWRFYFRPPDTRGASWYKTSERPASKLLSEGPPQDSRARRRGLRVVGERHGLLGCDPAGSAPREGGAVLSRAGR